MSETETNNKQMIPPGPYCYVIDFTKEFEDGVPVVYCPFHTTKEINGVYVPWCSFLDNGGISDDHTQEQWDKLIEYFGSDENVFDHLTLDLLFDSCKECRENDDYEYTKEQVIDWIKLIQKREN